MRRLLLMCALLALLVVPAASSQHTAGLCNAPKPQCQPPPSEPKVGRLITSGFELDDTTGVAPAAGEPDPFSVSSAATAIVSSGMRSGSFAAQTTYVGTASFVATSVTTATGIVYFFRSYFYFSALPAAGANAIGFMQVRTTASGSLSLYLWPGGTINQDVTSESAGVVVTAGQWVRVEASWKVDTTTSANDTASFLVNGGSISNMQDPPTVFGTSLVNIVRLGVTAIVGTPGNLNVLADDVALNDNQGASQNTWPGDGKVVLLKPASDSAVGTGWTLGTGTAISGNSGSTAVKNTPPLGVADLAVGSDVKQIRNATSNANVNYDANLTTYTAAGIAAGDTINVLDPMVATAAPVVTSAKAGTIGIASNPAITNIALAAGGTAGAFWSGAAGGTYPTGWKWSHGTITYAPTVTLGTAPVARITQVTSSTRIADVCALGMYVDYTPHPAMVWPPFRQSSTLYNL